jgi:hypothetical protein
MYMYIVCPFIRFFFTFGHCVVCPSSIKKEPGDPLWYLQTFLCIWTENMKLNHNHKLHGDAINKTESKTKNMALWEQWRNMLETDGHQYP